MERIKCVGPKIVLPHMILTILLVLMFQYIMGQRTEYYDQSEEPIWDASSEILCKGDVYKQNITCAKDGIVGVSQYIETPAAVSDTELVLTIYDAAGAKIARVRHMVEPDFMGYRDIFLEEPLCGLKGKRLICEYRNLTDSRLMLKNGHYEDVLCNMGKNICTRLIYRVMDMSRFKRTVYIGGIMLWFALSAVLLILTAKKVKPEFVFVFLYLSVGLLYMAANPLYGVPDERNHFLRAYGITEGDFITGWDEYGKGGSMLPENIAYGNRDGDMKLPDVGEAASVELSSRKCFITYGNTALYSPFTYTAQAIGIWIGKLFSSRAVFLAYSGRVAAWLMVGILLFLSIRYIPFGKYVLIGISLLPMNMHECISLAGDGFTYAVTMAFLAFVLYVRYTQTHKLSVRQYGLLYLLLFYLASCKIVYMPFCILAFFIPMERFGSKKKYFCHIVCAALVVAIVSIGWLMISSEFLVEFRPGVDSAQQIRYVLSNPTEYVEIVFRTILEKGESLVMNMLGSSLGHFNVRVNIGILVMAAASIGYVYGKEELLWMGERAVYQRMLMMAACASTALLIYTSLYVQWTAVGETLVDGVQGRYFLPVVLPVLLSWKGGKKKAAVQAEENQERSGIGVWYLVLLAVGMLTALTCLAHYII